MTYSSCTRSASVRSTVDRVTEHGATLRVAVRDEHSQVGVMKVHLAEVLLLRALPDLPAASEGSAAAICALEPTEISLWMYPRPNSSLRWRLDSAPGPAATLLGGSGPLLLATASQQFWVAPRRGCGSISGTT